MSQLSMSSIPGFFDIADAVMAGGEVLTDDTMVKISHNAKFGAVRCEVIFMGFYINGDTVGAPVSPVDGYSYSRSEVQYLYSLYATGSPAAGFVPGQATKPVVGPNTTGGKTLLGFAHDIDDSTGEVMCQAFFFGDGNQENTTDGILKVYALCQRSSVNQQN